MSGDVRSWMISDNLMLNDDKTEFLILGTRQQLAKVNIDNIKVSVSFVLLHFTTCVIFDPYASIYLRKLRRR